jgi:hypothetical protein
MRYIPSPIEFRYACIYSATANKSGRMQYHKVIPGESKLRISRTEFIEAFNNSHILAIRPLPIRAESQVFQLEFYV